MKTKHLADNPEFKKIKQAVIEAYDSPSWRFKVSKMKQSQIIAIYFSIQKRKYRKLKAESNYHQITLFEICPELLEI